MRDRVGAAVVAGLVLTQCLGAAAPRGPSTPEERTKALQIIHHLETDPLADTKDERQWLTLWLVEVPDIHVPLCTEFFPSLLRDSDSKKKARRRSCDAIRLRNCGIPDRAPSGG